MVTALLVAFFSVYLKRNIYTYMRGSHPDKTRSVVSFPDVIPSRTSPAVPEILSGNAQHLFGAEVLHDAADWGLTSPMATFSAHTALPPPPSRTPAGSRASSRHASIVPRTTSARGPLAWAAPRTRTHRSIPAPPTPAGASDVVAHKVDCVENTYHSVEDTYRNPALGYSIEIPRDLKATTGDQAGPERGLTISLPSGGKIVVFGEPNSLEWKTPVEGVQAALRREECPSGRQEVTPARVGTLTGAKGGLVCADRVVKLL